jgi:4-methyl-5(b-hydroxyethyl)-thiazole monophosphate biosynthesis
VKVAVLLAEGFETIEALTTVDILRRAGVTCNTIGTKSLDVTTSHSITIKADKVLNEEVYDYDVVVLPGGMPGATNIASCKKVSEAIENAEKSGKLVAAICASPAVVLASQGVFKGKKLTCYPAPAFIEMLKNNDYTAADVEIDGNIITANGPKSAFSFAKAICEYLNLTPKF